jgi:RimJ/RimL family protein N-acetyltransferase
MSVLSSAPPRVKIPKLDELDLVLTTGRLRLRPLQESDVDHIWPYVSNPQLSRLANWRAHTDRSQTHEQIQRSIEGFARGACVPWAIEHDGHVIGCINLEGIQYELRAWRTDRAELGYWIAPERAGNGMMTEAANAVLRCAFEMIGLHKLAGGCIAENIGSRRVIEKLGFRPVGRLEDDVWRDGRWWSILRYELTASEWNDGSTTTRVTGQ